MPTLMEPGSIDMSVMEAGGLGGVQPAHGPGAGGPLAGPNGPHQGVGPAGMSQEDLENLADQTTQNNLDDFNQDIENNNQIQNNGNNSTNVNFEINIQ